MKDRTPKPKQGQDAEPERKPPPLSDEMIAKLRAAVDAAQRKRMPRRDPAADSKDDD